MAAAAPGGESGKFQQAWHDLHGGVFLLEYYPQNVAKEDVNAAQFAQVLKDLEQGQTYVLANVDWEVSRSK